MNSHRNTRRVFFALFVSDKNNPVFLINIPYKYENKKGVY